MPYEAVIKRTLETHKIDRALVLMELRDDAEHEFHDALTRTHDAAMVRKLLPSLRALRR